MKREFCLCDSKNGEQGTEWLAGVIDLRVSHRVMVIQIIEKEESMSGRKEKVRTVLKCSHVGDKRWRSLLVEARRCKYWGY